MHTFIKNIKFLILTLFITTIGFSQNKQKVEKLLISPPEMKSTSAVVTDFKEKQIKILSKKVHSSMVLIFNLEHKENVKVLIESDSNQLIKEFSYSDVIEKEFKIDLSLLQEGIYKVKILNSNNEVLLLETIEKLK